MMTRTRLAGRCWLVLTATACALAAPGCGGGAGVDPTGGGSGGGGGATRPHASGGAFGADAGRGSGGGPATGGTIGSGGATNPGGNTSTGGSPGQGGAGTGGAGPAPDGGTGTADAAIVDGGGPAPPGVVAAGVRWIGRVDTTNPQRPRFAWSGAGFVARFSGTSLALQINNSGSFIFKVVLDGVPRPTFRTAAGQATYDLATQLAPGVHTVELYRQTEGSQGDSQFLALTVGGGLLMDPPAAPARLIEVVGDSISCGYGTLGTLADTDCFASESHWDAFESIAARALGAELSTVAISGQGMYRNYNGDMTNTLPMVYARALTNDVTPLWDFRSQPQVVVINLGTNDISNNKGDPGVAFRDAYLAFVQTVRARYPGALIVCMIGPLLSGADLATIRGYISAVVAMRNAAGDSQIEFLDRIATQTADKAACAYHPNPSENQLMADVLVTELRSRLAW